MKKIIKNYTTEIKVEKTIFEIQKLLSENGARGIATEYDNDGHVTDVFFKLIVNSRELAFRLPVKIEKVESALREEGLTRYIRNAENIAWRICKAWLETQLTLVNLEQVKMEEVFLPYFVMPNKKTLYETMKDSDFLLTGGEDES